MSNNAMTAEQVNYLIGLVDNDLTATRKIANARKLPPALKNSAASLADFQAELASTLISMLKEIEA